MGEYGSPPDTYFISLAAEILHCSYLELEAHPERARLMSTAFTLERGKRDGEALLKKNPTFQAMRKKALEELKNG